MKVTIEQAVTLRKAVALVRSHWVDMKFQEMCKKYSPEQRKTISIIGGHIQKLKSLEKLIGKAIWISSRTPPNRTSTNQPTLETTNVQQPP